MGLDDRWVAVLTEARADLRDVRAVHFMENAVVFDYTVSDEDFIGQIVESSNGGSSEADTEGSSDGYVSELLFTDWKRVILTHVLRTRHKNRNHDIWKLSQKMLECIDQIENEFRQYHLAEYWDPNSPDDTLYFLRPYPMPVLGHYAYLYSVRCTSEHTPRVLVSERLSRKIAELKLWCAHAYAMRLARRFDVAAKAKAKAWREKRTSSPTCLPFNQILVLIIHKEIWLRKIERNPFVAALVTVYREFVRYIHTQHKTFERYPSPNKLHSNFPNYRSLSPRDRRREKPVCIHVVIEIGQERSKTYVVDQPRIPGYRNDDQENEHVPELALRQELSQRTFFVSRAYGGFQLLGLPTKLQWFNWTRQSQSGTCPLCRRKLFGDMMYNNRWTHAEEAHAEDIPFRVENIWLERIR